MDWSARKKKNYHKLQWVNDHGLIEAVGEACGIGEHFLDIGCGTGAMMELAHRNFDNCFGIDPDSYLLKKAPPLVNVIYENTTIEKITYSDKFDCALFRNTLHHIKDPLHAIRLAREALKPGGRLVICQGVPPSNQLVPFYQNLFRLFDDRHILTEGDLIHFLRFARFEDITLKPYFMEKVNLLDWLEKVSQGFDISQRALEMHLWDDRHFMDAYEISKSKLGDFKMTWRFAIVTGIKT